MKRYDILIIGAGPAGLTAGIYASRAGYRAAILEKNIPGGQAGTAQAVANYPGIIEVAGYALMQTMTEQAQIAGAEIVYGNAEKFDFTQDFKTVTGAEMYSAAAVILASGLSAKPLGLSGEAELVGSGISHCAECDGAFFKGKTVTVYGAGNSAIQDAEYLSQIAGKLYVVGAGSLKHIKIESAEKIENARIEKLIGNPLSAIELTTAGGVRRTVKTDGLFLATGKAPDTASFKKAGVSADSKGYIITTDKMETNIPGVFACGDARVSPLKQIVTACSDGAIAAVSACAYLRSR